MTTESSSPSSSAAAAAKEDAVSSASAAASSISLPPNQFELELEFVQSLASPAYLHYLATSGILYQQSFLDYLRYLRYWKQPQYAKYLLYPHCLYFLDLLVPPGSDPDENDDGDDVEEGGTNASDGSKKKSNTNATKTDSGEAFRREMAQVPFRNFVHEQQFYSWQFRSARLYGKGVEEEKE